MRSRNRKVNRGSGSSPGRSDGSSRGKGSSAGGSQGCRWRGWRHCNC
ncbi:hypothetical protein DBR06_SOUSAS10710062 [Sousa chinensis]|uniref:Uncharacterized protein n=1 Tax=Sousa chinensis TaxID=103600 RepID=A0A484GGC8_SOUCH|nr:hypothetical protein DBR06_SOUSAS10710062 [Sousa chinensis]